MRSCLRGLAVLLCLSVCWPDSMSLGQSTDLQLRIVEREGHRYLVWTDGRIELILDEETARKFGVIVERFDTLSEQVRIAQQKSRERDEMLKQAQRYANELKTSSAKTEGLWQGRLEECQRLIEQEQEHIKNLEAEKRPSHLKAYILGGVIGAGVAAVLVGIGGK